MRVGLFITCLNDTFFPGVGRATVELLERLGCEVVFPEDQTCCGQMHANSGYRKQADRLARRFADVFAGLDCVVTPSGSCAASVRHQHPRSDVTTQVFELSEFLVDHLGVVDVGASLPAKVALHPTCHSLRLLEVGDRPRRLLEAVRGLELVDLDRVDECCGFGGTFAAKNSAVSAAMLDDKLAAIAASGAELVTAADSSCLMHIGGGLSRDGSGVRPIHLAEILAARA